MVPLAFLLRNAGIEELDPVVGIYKAPWGPNGCMSGDGCEILLRKHLCDQIDGVPRKIGGNAPAALPQPVLNLQGRR